MEIPSLSRLETFASTIVSGGFLGIDIGTSSAKIVQLSMDRGTPSLDTYGEIEMGPYGDREARRAAHLNPEQQSAALQDLLHDVEAGARKGGLSISLSAALISLIKTPKRDKEQMDKLIAKDAQSYIPMPIENVEIDWLVVGGDEPQSDAFARAGSKQPAQPHMQELMIVAVGKETVRSCEAAASAAGIAVGFYELDIFSAARACAAPGEGCTLLLDIGASNVKMSLINGRGMPLAAHVIPGGGEQITESIMKACGWNFEKAENAKRERGFGDSGSYTQEENLLMAKALQQSFGSIIADASRFLEDTANKHDIDVARVQLLGGGALMPGVVEYATRTFNKTVTLAHPFAAVRAPMILEDIVKEVGPKYATAVGLALRGVRA